MALGAICLGNLATKTTNTALPWAWWVLLPLSVWIVYSIDHLLDAEKARNRFLSQRHYFYLKHNQILKKIVATLVIISTMIAIIFLPLKLFLGGLMLALCIVIYFIYFHFFDTYRLPKECIIAIIYTAGIWFGPMMFSNTIEKSIYILCFTSFATALSNLLIFSVLSKEEDQKSGYKSLAIDMKEKILNSLIIVLIIGTISIQLFVIISFTLASICIILMNLILLLIFLKRNFFKINDTYRILGDGIFFLPIVV